MLQCSPHCVCVCVFIFPEVDIDVDQYRPTEVDRLNLTALDYGVAAGAFSR